GMRRRGIADAAARHAGAPPSSTVLALALQRLALEGFGLFAFAITVIGASSAFAWPPGVRAAIVGLTLRVTGARAAAITARCVLSPRPGRLRLIALDDAAARRRYRLINALVIVMAAIYVGGRLLGVDGHLGGLAVVWRIIAGAVVAVLALALVHGDTAAAD